MLLPQEVLIEGPEAAAAIISRDTKRVKFLLLREVSIRLLTSKAGNKAVEAIEAVAAEVDTEATMIDIRTKKAVLIPSTGTTIRLREVTTLKVLVSSVSSRSSTPREVPAHTSNIIRTMITTTRAGTTAITKEIREGTPPSLLTMMGLRS